MIREHCNEGDCGVKNCRMQNRNQRDELKPCTMRMRDKVDLLIGNDHFIFPYAARFLAERTYFETNFIKARLVIGLYRADVME